MERRRHTAEFKSESVKLLLIDGLSVSDVSRELGVSKGLLYTWKAKHLDELEAQTPESAQSPKALAAENAELRKRLASSERMNEILRKTVSYFIAEV